MPGSPELPEVPLTTCKLFSGKPSSVVGVFSKNKLIEPLNPLKPPRPPFPPLPSLVSS